MAPVPDVKIKVTVDSDSLRASLYEMLEALHCTGSAEALYAASGTVTIPRRLRDTRDGREQAVLLFAQALLDDKVGVIVISDSQPLSETLESLGYQPSTTIQGYA